MERLKIAEQSKVSQSTAIVVLKKIKENETEREHEKAYEKKDNNTEIEKKTSGMWNKVFRHNAFTFGFDKSFAVQQT